MNRCIEFEYRGRMWTAYCPANAVFDIYDKYPDARDDIVSGTGFLEPTRAGFDACCWMIAEFARWGEIARRQHGHDAGPILTVSEAALASVEEAAALRDVVGATLRLGFARAINTEDAEAEVDVTLATMKAAEKKEPPRGQNGPITSRRAPRFGVSVPQRP